MNSVKLNLLDKIILQKNLISDNVVSCSECGRYSVIVEDGIYIYYLNCGTTNPLQSFAFEKDFVPVPHFNIVSRNDLRDDFILSLLHRKKLYSTCLSNNSLPCTSDMHKNQFKSAKWSPQGLIDNCQCAIACLTQTGIITIYVYGLNNYQEGNYYMISNITQKCMEYFSTDEICKSLADKLNQFMTQLEVKPLCVSWTGMISKENEKYCLLIVGHNSGYLTFWKFNARKANDVTENGISFLFCHKTEMLDVTTLHFMLTGNGGILIMANSEGCIKTLSIEFEDKFKLNFKEEILLRNKSDQCEVNTFCSIIYEENVFIIAQKGNILLIYMFNNKGQLVDMQDYNDFQDFRITQLQHFRNNFLFVLLSSGDMVLLGVKSLNNELIIEVEIVDHNFNLLDYEARGVILSRNNAFFAVLVNNRNIISFKNVIGTSKMLIFNDTLNNPLNLLMKSSNESLRNYWDCLEVLRLTSIINKTLPTSALPQQLNYDKLSVFKLKMCFFLVKISDMVHDKLPTLVDRQLVSCEDLNYIIKIKLTIQHMKLLYNIYRDQNYLSEFHMQSLDVLNMFLTNVILKDIFFKLGLKDNTFAELDSVIRSTRELMYPIRPKCVFCKNDIIGLTCEGDNLHVDFRCSISLMQITNWPYYKCMYCKGIVHERMKDIYNELFCPYCDVPLQFVGAINDSLCLATNKKKHIDKKKKK